MQIGIIGLGAMGGAMARRLLDVGYEVYGFDTDAGRLSTFKLEGGHAEQSAAAVADHARFVISSVPSVSASKDVALGEKGVIQGKAIKVLIETSTIGSQQMEKLAGPLFDRGIGLLDAPISGGSDAATKGELTAIIAGPTAILNETRQLWNDLSTTLFHVSEKQGTAQLFKLLNNYVMRCSMIASCEAMAAGVAAGADEAQLLDVLNHCTAANFTTRVLFPSSVIPGAAMAPLTMALSEVRAFHAEVEKYGIQSELSVGAINVLTKASSESKNLSDWYRKLKVGA